MLNKNIIWTGVSTGIKAIVGLISNKLFSSFLGPTGIALISAFLNASSIFSAVGSGLNCSGVTKYISETDLISRKLNIAKNALFIAFVLICSLDIFIWCNLGLITRYIFNSSDYLNLTFLFSLALPSWSLNLVVYSIVNGYEKYNHLNKMNILNSCLTLLSLVIFLQNKDLTHAIYSLIITQVFSSLYNIYILNKIIPLRIFTIFFKIDSSIIISLSKYAAITIFSMIAIPMSQLFIRKILINTYSFEIAGFWDALNKISGMNQLFFVSIISVFYLPKLSAISCKSEILKMSKKIFMAATVCFFCLFLFLSFFSDFIVHLLFSRDFFPIIPLLKYQILGDYFKIITWIFSYITLAKGLFGQFLFLESLYICLNVFLSVFYVKFGIGGMVLAYNLSYLVMFFFSVLIFNKALKKYE